MATELLQGRSHCTQSDNLFTKRYQLYLFYGIILPMSKLLNIGQRITDLSSSSYDCINMEVTLGYIGRSSPKKFASKSEPFPESSLLRLVGI